MPGGKTKSLRAKLILLLLLIVALLCLVFAWRTTSFGSWLDIDLLVGQWRQIAATLGATSIAYVVVASIVAIPLGIIIVVAALTFEPWLGATYVVAGTSIGAAINYLIGSYLGHEALLRVGGERINKLSAQLAKRGILSIVVIRMLPIAPFAVVNLVAGATHIRFFDFMAGTFLGILPSVIALTFFADKIGFFFLGVH